MQSLKSLTAVDRDILYVALMDAAAPVSKIAQTVGCRPYAVQAALKKFHANGLISRRVMINPFRLGLFRHAIYLTLSSEGRKEREEIADYLARYGAASVVLEVGGEYDFFVAILVRNAVELAQFQGSLAAAFPGALLRKDLGVTVLHSVFGEKSLVTDRSLYSECSCAISQETFEADSVDQQILFLASDGVFRSSAQLARRLGIASSTVEYRLKKLRERMIICGDMYEVRGELLGLLNYIVLVQMRGVADPFQGGLLSFAREHPHIAHISHEVGLWDYQVGVAVQEAGELTALLHELNTRFKGEIAEAKAIPMFKARKVRDYPFDPTPSGATEALRAS